MLIPVGSLDMSLALATSNAGRIMWIGSFVCCRSMRITTFYRESSDTCCGGEPSRIKGSTQCHSRGTHLTSCESGTVLSEPHHSNIAGLHEWSSNTIVMVTVRHKWNSTNMISWMRLGLASESLHFRSVTASPLHRSPSHTEVQRKSLLAPCSTPTAVCSVQTRGESTLSSSQMSVHGEADWEWGLHRPQLDHWKGGTHLLKFVGVPRRSSGSGVCRRRSGTSTLIERMPKRQASEGAVTEGTAATYEHSEGAADVVATELREGIREMIAVNLLPCTVWMLRYTGHGYPTIDNVELLRSEKQFASLGEGRLRELLHDTSPMTAVEAGDGHFPAVRAKRRAARLSSTEELAAIFDECVLPAQLQQSTRVGYWGSWKTVLSWGIAHDEVRSLLPMSLPVLKAITQEMLMLGSSAGTIRNLWSAIEDRHRFFGYTPPLAAREGDFSRYSKAVASIKGMPSRVIFPVGTHHVRLMLELVGLSLAQRRDILICVLGTVMCLRVGEISQLQICDVLWRLDGGFHVMYVNTLGCRIYKRKQDTARKGLYPRAGSEVANRLRLYVNSLGLKVSNNCSKGRSPGARCRACAPLFPKLRNNAAATEPVSRQQVTDAVLNSLSMIGVDTKHYSGISMRRGGISAGLAARVPEPILFLQSGHGSNCAARNYMVPRDPHVLYETYLAFGLGL